jgi:hypothetical protein
MEAPTLFKVWGGAGPELDEVLTTYAHVKPDELTAAAYAAALTESWTKQQAGG